MATQPEPPQGTVGLTSFATLAVAFAIGAVLGYGLVVVSEAVNGTAPVVEWSAVVGLVVVAVVVGGLAWTTYRTVHRDRQRIPAQRRRQSAHAGKGQLDRRCGRRWRLCRIRIPFPRQPGCVLAAGTRAALWLRCRGGCDHRGLWAGCWSAPAGFRSTPTNRVSLHVGPPSNPAQRPRSPWLRRSSFSPPDWWLLAVVTTTWVERRGRQRRRARRCGVEDWIRLK
ncbi:MAG: hypothetical protein WKF73_15970 [Nocardioidaceae bacterium]